MDITLKRTGVALYAEGFFGNYLRQWDDAEALANEPRPPKKVVIRQRAAHGGGYCRYDCDVSEALWIAHVESIPNVYFGEQLPGQPDNVIFQGEYMRGEIETLFYSTERAFYRAAMLSGVHRAGPGCRLVLRQFMDSRSYERLDDLAEAFPGHAIEFTVCDEPVGSDGLNTIIWEVRKY